MNVIYFFGETGVITRGEDGADPLSESVFSFREMDFFFLLSGVITLSFSLSLRRPIESRASA